MYPKTEYRVHIPANVYPKTGNRVHKCPDVGENVGINVGEKLILIKYERILCIHKSINRESKLDCIASLIGR